MPKSLGVDPHSYSRDQFYADVQAYIRFKTPVVPLIALLDLDNPRSALARVRRWLARANGSADALPRQDLSHEVRLLGCQVRANVRDCTADIREKMGRVNGNPARQSVLLADVREAIRRMLDDLFALLSEFRALRPDFLQPKRPQWLRELFEYVDEYLSISTEAYLTAIVGAIDADPPLRQALAPSRERLVTSIQAEQEHRRGAGYVSVLEPDGRNDTYVHRKGALKKFVSSVLFLEMKKERDGRGLSDIVAGIAAAVAMLFSTVAAIWSQSFYGINSFPFVITIVIAYVFKDRIKEWLRTYFWAKLGRRLHDYSVEIHDPTAGVVMGRCRESFAYLSAERVPPDILRHRHADSTSVLEPESKPEVVMRYVKDISLRGKRIASKHGRLGDVNDIIRLNISSFLGRMDEPIRHVKTFDPAIDGVRTIACPKTYHVNLVLVLRAAKKVATVERFRIILDKRGIVRLEVVDLPA